jgi:hypothetical protein
MTGTGSPVPVMFGWGRVGVGSGGEGCSLWSDVPILVA